MTTILNVYKSDYTMQGEIKQQTKGVMRTQSLVEYKAPIHYPSIQLNTQVLNQFAKQCILMQDNLNKSKQQPPLKGGNSTEPPNGLNSEKLALNMHLEVAGGKVLELTNTTITTSEAVEAFLKAEAEAAAATTASVVAATPASNKNKTCSKSKFKIPSDILDDLASRFIINVPDMALNDLIRICFQIELAHWFYLDFFCETDNMDKRLQTCGMKHFAMQIFQHIPFLNEHLSSIDSILESWKNYKLSVPTYGAILISEDLNYCLLVQSYFAKCSWGFPKGKINEHEDTVHCAAREVFEETGYDISKMIQPDNFIEAVVNYQFTRLYVVTGVPLQTQFQPRTRYEIKSCEWFLIDSLPNNKNDAISKAKLGINGNSFFMILPFVKHLKKWVSDKQNGIEPSRKLSSESHHTSTPISKSPSFTNGGFSPIASKTTGSNQTISTHKNGIINQKNLNGLSCRKNKEKCGASNGNGGFPKTPNTASTQQTPICIQKSASTKTATNNRLKRQRHKSMGDFDGIQSNSLSINYNQNHCNGKNGTLLSEINSPSTLPSTTINTQSPLLLSTLSSSSNLTNNDNKLNLTTKIVAAGSNGNKNGNSVGDNTNANIKNNSNCGPSTSTTGKSTSTTIKRQLFHSHSQSSAQHGEKIVSSFDLIRKEKQQKAQAEKAAAKAQKQQQQQQQTPNGNSNNAVNRRARAKSYSDKPQNQQQPLSKVTPLNFKMAASPNGIILPSAKGSGQTTPPSPSISTENIRGFVSSPLPAMSRNTASANFPGTPGMMPLTPPPGFITQHQQQQQRSATKTSNAGQPLASLTSSSSSKPPSPSQQLSSNDAATIELQQMLNLSKQQTPKSASNAKQMQRKPAAKVSLNFSGSLQLQHQHQQEEQLSQLDITANQQSKVLLQMLQGGPTGAKNSKENSQTNNNNNINVTKTVIGKKFNNAEENKMRQQLKQIQEMQDTEEVKPLIERNKLRQQRKEFMRQKQLEQLQQQQREKRMQNIKMQQNPQMKLTPFNSWTNFSFTKNLITNVFC